MDTKGQDAVHQNIATVRMSGKAEEYMVSRISLLIAL